MIRQLVNKEKSRGIEHEKLNIGGFDMGETIAMHIGYRYNHMYLLTEWDGRTGKYLARGHGVRTESSEVRAP